MEGGEKEKSWKLKILFSRPGKVMEFCKFTESFGKGSVFANFIGDEVIRGSRSNRTRFSNGEYLG